MSGNFILLIVYLNAKEQKSKPNKNMYFVRKSFLCTLVYDVHGTYTIVKPSDWLDGSVLNFPIISSILIIEKGIPNIRLA